MRGSVALITLLSGAVGFLTAPVCLATPHTAFLDFDHDHDLWTVDSLSPERWDTLTVILQVGDEPIGPGDDLFFEVLTCVCQYYDGHGSYLEFCGVRVFPEIEDWCNQTLFDDCVLDYGTGEGCEPPQMIFSVAPGGVFEPGERYRVCQLMAGIADHPCQYYLEAFYDIAGSGYDVTNRVWLNVEPASIDEGSDAPEPPAVGPTWGALKALFR